MAGELQNLTLRGKNAHVEYGRVFSGAIADCSAKVMRGNPALPATFYTMKKNLIARYPRYYQEVCDRALGAGVESDHYLAAMSDAIDELHGEHCTNVIITRPDGRMLFGHNEDGYYNADNCAMVTYDTGDELYTEFSAMESMPGYTITINYKTGLVTAANYVYTPYALPAETSAQFILRDIISCGSIEEIEAHIKGVTCATGFSIDIADAAAGRCYNLEMQYDRYDIIEIKGKYAHSNHITHLDGVPVADGGSNTVKRREAALELLKRVDVSTATIEDVTRILEHQAPCHDDTIHSDHGPDYSITAAMMLFDSAAREVLVTDYIGSGTLHYKRPCKTPPQRR